MIENIASSSGRDQCSVETEVLGCNHAEIGAYLLGLWGLPSPIVEAVAWHQRPSESPVAEFSPLAAVHVANRFYAQLHSDLNGDPNLDQAFLERIGLDGRKEVWMERCSEHLLEERVK